MKTFMKWTGVAVVAALMLLGGQRVWAHCQIPCGIYDDQLRTKLMAEDITTIEKSMQEIIRLSAQANPDNNQLVRWVVNKEDHVARFNETVTYYFMAQRIKVVPETEKDAYRSYVQQLTLLHEMLVTAMKCKQTTDATHVTTLRALLDAFEDAYFKTQEHKHN
jgi:nickel superoxide dismutase